jgi:hypothetical protein
MRRFLCVIGATALGVVGLVVIGVGVLIWNGRGLDVESKAYVDAAVPAITSHWSKEALLDRATPELRAAATPDQIAAVFNNFSRLGPLVQYEGAAGQANMMYLLGKGEQVSASYEAKAKYENGEATLRLVLLKRDGKWQIQNFHVDGHPGARTSQSM